VGTLKKCVIHWDELGFSKGTAEVEYESPEDAQKAIKDFNGKI
jgi:RNA recognition motif-containing protein